MKIAIIGRSEVLYDTARALLGFGYEIACILTAKEASEYTRTAKDFEDLAAELNVPFARGSNILKHKCFLRDAKADIAVSINFSGIIPQAVIDIFPSGILNAHGGDLPRYRGNACQAWALLNGEDQIGLCIHKMIGDELDSGDIISRDYYPAHINTKIGEVWSWVQARTPHLFLSACQNLAKNPKYILEAQPKDTKFALRCYPRKPEDGKIDWSKSAIDVLRLINASGPPYAGAFATLNGQKILIFDAEIMEDGEIYCAVPGQITKIDKLAGSYCVATGKGKITIKHSVLGTDGTTVMEHLSSPRMRLG